MKRLTKEKAELLAQQFRATIGVSMKEPISGIIGTGSSDPRRTNVPVPLTL